MSKITNITHRFENVKIGAENEIDIRIKGMQGEDIEKMFVLIDNDKTAESLTYVTLLTLQKDDASITETEVKKLDMADIITVANSCTKLSGLGEMFKLGEKKLKGEESQENQNKNEKSSPNSKIVSLRKGLANGEIGQS